MVTQIQIVLRHQTYKIKVCKHKAAKLINKITSKTMQIPKKTAAIKTMRNIRNNLKIAAYYIKSRQLQQHSINRKKRIHHKTLNSYKKTSFFRNQ